MYMMPLIFSVIACLPAFFIVSPVAESGLIGNQPNHPWTEKNSRATTAPSRATDIEALPSHTAQPSPNSDILSTPKRTSWGKPILDEEFNGNHLNRAAWVIYNSPEANVNPRTTAATTVSRGQLHLTGGIYYGRDMSGGVASKLLQRYGRWEVRLRADPGRGYSPVTLLWPELMGVPEYAEVDFAEIIDPTRQAAEIFVHHGPADDQVHNEMTADFTRWHVVAVDWLPDHLTFWLDGKAVWTYRGPLIPRRDRMGLTLQNDQICDRGPEYCRDRTTPKWVHMDVDWVRVYRAPKKPRSKIE